MINAGTLNIDSVIVLTDILNIKITPYTIKLIVDTYINEWYQTRYMKILIMSTKKIMHDSYIKIMMSDDIKLQKFVKDNDIKSIDYDPEMEDEIPEIVAVNHHHDYDSSESGEKDYVEEILNEYKV